MRFAPAILLLFPILLAAAPQAVNPAVDDYSGMYSFLREGEFIQITVGDKAAVSGFISRFGDSEGDRGVFLNQFIKSGKLDGNKLSFTTDVVHGNSFSFDGVVARGPGKKLDEEAYYVLRGNLTRISTDAEKKTTSQVTQVELKSFPRDTGPN
jgi:hypothetical protein